MSSEATKYALAKAMEECMRTQSVENITVTEIVRRCGVARQTFYRNFLDKYDLINWYFGKLLDRSFEHMGSGRTVREGLERKFEYIRAERVFFAGGGDGVFAGALLPRQRVHDGQVGAGRHAHRACGAGPLHGRRPPRAAGSPVQAAWIAVMLQFLIKLLFLLTCTLQNDNIVSV